MRMIPIRNCLFHDFPAIMNELEEQPPPPHTSHSISGRKQTIPEAAGSVSVSPEDLPDNRDCETTACCQVVNGCRKGKPPAVLLLLKLPLFRFQNGRNRKSCSFSAPCIRGLS